MIASTIGIFLTGCEKTRDCADLAKETAQTQKADFLKKCPKEAQEAAAAQFRAGEFKASPKKEY